MTSLKYPTKVFHWINNKETSRDNLEFFNKINPANGKVLGQVVRGGKKDIDHAITCAVKTFPLWRRTPVIARANILRTAALLMQDRKQELATVVHLETGKSMQDAAGEVEGSIELAFFWAGEGRRFYGKTTTSAMPNRTAMIIREPVGICALIVPANTPIANVAWKAFPALLCGNTAVMKASKDTPYIAVLMAKIFAQAGLPAGVFNVLQGNGEEVGDPLVADARINLVSFTGSVAVGKRIGKIAEERLCKVSLELGGKNPFVVCDDADLGKAAEFAVLSAFSNAGQRCASGSRIIVFKNVYDEFKQLLLTKTKSLKLGFKTGDDFGPVINKLQLEIIISEIEKAKKAGAKILCGGSRLTDLEHKSGYYIAPTLIEGSKSTADISCNELFGPVANLYEVSGFEEALNLANDSQYGLTSAIHTTSIHRVQEFISRCETGVVSVNGPSYGSEPHMPFGGVKNSGNGSREPGTEALDVYTNIKTVYIRHDPLKV